MMHEQRRDREEHTERNRDREDYLSRLHGFGSEDECAPVSERRQLQIAMYKSAMKQEAKEELERRQEQNARTADARPADARPADNAAPALAIIGVTTVRQAMTGGDSDALQEHFESHEERTDRAHKAYAQALVTNRFEGANAANPKTLVMADGKILVGRRNAVPQL